MRYFVVARWPPLLGQVAIAGPLSYELGGPEPRKTGVGTSTVEFKWAPVPVSRSRPEEPLEPSVLRERAQHGAALGGLRRQRGLTRSGDADELGPQDLGRRCQNQMGEPRSGPRLAVKSGRRSRMRVPGGA
jgi:hypothetical protein